MFVKENPDRKKKKKKKRRNIKRIKASVIKIEHYETSKLLNDSFVSKFMIRKWTKRVVENEVTWANLKIFQKIFLY